MKFLFHKSRQEDSNNRKIFRAAVTVGSLTLIVKIAATLKDLVVARWFGRSDGLDAFLIAFLLPSFAVTLVMGALSGALIPVVVEVRHKEGEEAAQKLCSSVGVLSAAALVLIAIVLGLLAPVYLPLLGSNFSPAKQRLTRELLYLLLPFFVFSGIATFASAILNAGEKFVLAAIAPLLTPLVIILFLQSAAGRWNVFALGAGVLVGGVMEAALLLWTLRVRKVKLAFTWQGMTPAVREVLKQYVPMLAACFLMGGTSVVDQSMAAMLAGGSVAALNYANKVIGAILSVGGIALSTAVLPYLSQMVAQQDWEGCRHTLKRYTLLLLSVSVPFTICLMIFSRPLVRILFQRGAFHSADTDLVSWVQICYCIQIPFYVLNLLIVRFLSAAKRNDLLMYSAAINLVLDIVLNLVLMRVWGVAGIALSTSLVYIVGFSFLGIWSVKLLGHEAASKLANSRPQVAAP